MLLGLVACHGSEAGDDEGRAYQVSATLRVDSTVVLHHMALYSDSHIALHEDSLILSPDLTFSLERHTPGFDELYLCSDGGELCRFFATGGMSVNITLSGRADSLVAVFDATQGDSINPWLQEQRLQFAQMNSERRHTVLDSLCHSMSSDLRCGLLLREEVENLKDSVFVRRCLGALSAEAKPEWLVKSIDNLLVEASEYLSRSRRLSGSSFQVNDTTTFDFSVGRTDYLLLYCWADYDPMSLDSLKALAQMIEDDYSTKRLQLVSFCLHAANKTSWQTLVDGIEGTHIWLPAGLADQRMRDWRIMRVPTLILCDMYNNQQHRDPTDRDLRSALTRIPNRSGFAHTYTKPHGR